MGPSMSFFAAAWRKSYVWYTTSITENTSISVTSQNALQQSITDDLQQDITNLPGQSQFQEEERDPPPPYSVEDPYSQDDESSAESDESSELEYEDFSPWPKPNPGYTRRLIRRVYISLDELLDEETFDEDAWEKTVYGANVIIVDKEAVPKGWILIDGTAPEKECLLMTDPSPPPKVIKKRWNPYNDDDPNNELNLDRAENDLPPIDFWGIGVEYTQKRNGSKFPGRVNSDREGS